MNEHLKDFAKYKVESEFVEGGVEGGWKKSKNQHSNEDVNDYKIRITRKLILFNSSALIAI